jgi:hypothetical protein
MSLDTQTTLRLAVSHRLEKALKVDHLTTNPLKAERIDFIPPLVLKRIEDAAKRNLDLSWTLDNAAGKQPLSGCHPANSSRDGKTDYARQRGRGRGASKGATKGGKVDQAAEEAEARGAEPLLPPERTQSPTGIPNRRPMWSAGRLQHPDAA